jgi:uncharacterized protein YbbC (DUF1343 family)
MFCRTIPPTGCWVAKKHFSVPLQATWEATIAFVAQVLLVFSIVSVCFADQHSSDDRSTEQNIAAYHVASDYATPSIGFVKFGIDNLLELRLEPLRKMRIALVCNTASRTRFARETLGEIRLDSTIEISAILVPEHGYTCRLPAGISNLETTLCGVPVYVLTGAQRRPTREMLRSCDAVVIDLQDVGIRPYATVATLYWILDACAEYGIRVYVLDRPNPLGGTIVDGPLPDTTIRQTAFTIVPIPYIHGMTIGELALMINHEGWLTADPATGIPRQCRLNIVKMRRWKRTLTWENLRCQWVPTSPNVPSPAAIRGMALVGLIGETDVVSIGIGTDTPFQVIGAPDFNEEVIGALASLLAQYSIRTHPVEFTPKFGQFAGQSCRGIAIEVDPSAQLPYYSIACSLLAELAKSYPPFLDKINDAKCRQRLAAITGDPTIGMPGSDFYVRRNIESERFISLRKRYLLYP